MAVDGVDVAAISNILKTYYMAIVPVLFKTTHLFLSRLKRTTREVSGNVFTHPAQTGHSQGIGPAAHTADLPTPGHMHWINPQWSPKPHRGRIRVYGLPIAETRNNQGAYMRIWATEMRDIMKAYMSDYNRECLGDGRGALAYLGSAQDSLNPNVLGYQGPNGSHMLALGMRTDLIDATDNKTPLVQSAEVTSWGKTQVTLDAAPSGSAADDYFVRAGSIDSSDGTCYAFHGLHGIVATTNPAVGNFGGIDRTTEELWRAQVLSAGNTLVLDDVDYCYDLIEDFSDGVVSLILTRRRVQRAIGRLLWEQVRYAGAGTLEGRWRGLKYDNKTIYADNAVWRDTMLFLDMSTFEMLQVQPIRWMDKDGSVIHRTTDKEAYEASFTHHAELACHNPPRNAKLESIGYPGQGAVAA
jgi:hypothetical protein